MSFRKSTLLILSIIILSPLSYSQSQSIGKAKYKTSIPQGEIGPSTYATFPDYPNKAVPAIPKVVSNFPKPVQTHDWWTSFIWNASASAYYNWDGHSWPSYAHPLAYQACRYGLKIKYPDKLKLFDFNDEPNGSYRYEMGSEDFTFSLDSMDLTNNKQTLVKDYSDWSFSALWDDANGHSFSATMGHGFLYTYFNDIKGTIIIRFNGSPTIFKNDGNMLGISINDHYYALFAPSGATWETNLQYSFDENETPGATPKIVSKPAFKCKSYGKNYFSIALLPDKNDVTFNTFKKHAYVFVDSTEVHWNYDESKACLKTNYIFHTTPKEGDDTSTLYAMYRHQWMQLKNVSTNYTYTSARGIMKVNEGNSFSLEHKNFGIIPTLPFMGKLNEDLNSLIKDEVKKLDGTSPNSDTYFGAIKIARLAELAYLSYMVGDNSSRDKFLDKVQTGLENWFDEKFYYDSIWNTLIGYPAIYGSESNLNDHHFHYGYFVRAAAILAQFRPAWAKDEQYGGMVKLLIKDVANWDKKDLMFPFLRFFDAYAGHSWAGGSANGWLGLYSWGEDQESSSESMNFSAAIFLWGLITKDTTIRDLGLYLYLNEKQAIEQYWFDSNHEVFPKNYNQVSATRIWSSGADKVPYDPYTQDEYLLGINVVPTFSSTLYLSTIPDYVSENYDNMIERNGGQPDFFRDLMCFYLSFTNSTDATSLFSELNYSDFTNTTKANLMYWLTAIDSLGFIDTTIRSNHCSSMVFKNKNNIRYVVFNPGPQKEVTFSNGFKMLVPADTLIVNTIQSENDTTQQQNKFQNYQVFPNPGSGTFFTKELIHDTEIELFDQYGRKVLNKFVLKGNKFKFELRSPGIYFLRFGNTNDSKVKKIVVMR